MENNKNTQYELNKGLAQMLKGGVIMDVTTPEQARIAEAAGACAVMALERTKSPRNGYPEGFWFGFYEYIIS